MIQRHAADSGTSMGGRLTGPLKDTPSGWLLRRQP